MFSLFQSAVSPLKPKSFPQVNDISISIKQIEITLNQSLSLFAKTAHIRKEKVFCSEQDVFTKEGKKIIDELVGRISSISRSLFQERSNPARCVGDPKV